MARILLVEDETGIANLLRLALVGSGHALVHATTLAEARSALSSTEPDAIVLDLSLPDGDGIDLCRDLRTGSTVPILILTARRGEADRVAGLELGADDYVVKPFSPRELVARIGAVLRRQTWARDTGRRQEAPRPAGRPHRRRTTDGPVIRWKGVEIDERRREVHACGRPVELTRTELRLLLTLARRPGQVFSREQLIEMVWDGAFIQDRVVDSVVSRVRRKLGALADGSPAIRTVHGIGYAFGS
jgi:two-component system phosphate regulon response regulator PhoB